MFVESKVATAESGAMAAEIGVDVAVVIGFTVGGGRGGGGGGVDCWTTFSLLRVCLNNGLLMGADTFRAVDRLCRSLQAPHSLLLLLLPLSFCCSSGVVSLELDITGVVLGVG